MCVLIVSVPARAQERSLGAIGVGEEDCIRLTEIIPGSPAETAGLAVGDILTTIDGEPTKRITGKFELTTSKKPGSRFAITYLREDQGATATLIVETWARTATSAPANPTVSRVQTTLFGTTLGQPNPQLNCGSWQYARDFVEGNQRSPVCGLGDNADMGPVIDELDGNVEQITAWWEPEVCWRVQVALKAKFQSPGVSSWRGRNGLGLPISGTVWTWKRKNGDVIEFTHPSPDRWPDCRLNASTSRWRSQPEEEDHL